MRWRGFTLLEMLVCVMFLGLVVFFCVGWTRSVRLAAKRDAAVELFAVLNDALGRYHAAESAYPPESDDRSAAEPLRLLRSHPKTRTLLAERIPARHSVEGILHPLCDPWGTPLRYLGPSHAAPRVLANNGRPFFVSAGPDMDFGDKHIPGLGDNMASDDPQAIDRFRSTTQPAR